MRFGESAKVKHRLEQESRLGRVGVETGLGWRQGWGAVERDSRVRIS